MDATRQALAAGLVVLAAVLGGAVFAAPGTASETATAPDDGGRYALDDAIPAQTTNVVRITQEFAALRERPGVVRVTRHVDVPDNVESLETTLPEGATVTGTSGGFSRIGDRAYEWSGGSDTPSISYRLAVNETGEVAGPEGTAGRYLFADVGEWGLFRRPQAPVEARYRGSIDFQRETAVDGPGAAGEWLIYVGEATETRRRAHGQTVRLVEPAAADLAESREDIFASVTDASDALRVGQRDDEVLMVAAPTTVDWAVEGLQVGESDIYVTADERVDEADNVWLHEYVHSRQDFATTAETRWLGEATATYYAALLTLEQERIGYDAFRRHLAEGADRRYADVVLADPSTWGRAGNYQKGALVAGDLDRRLRDATDSRSDLQAVVRRLNERRTDVEADDLVGIVRDVGTADVAAATDRYTTTTDTPEMWDAAAHQAAFGALPPRISVALPEDVEGASYRISGPYRSLSVDSPPLVLVTNETLAVDIRLSNDGGRTGSYNLSYGLADGPLAFEAGSLDPGEHVTETVEVRADRAGAGPVRVGEYTVDASVLEPATPRIDVLRANRSRAAPGTPVGLEIDVTNPADRPGKRTLDVTVDGRTVASESVVLDAGDSRTVTTAVRLTEPGSHVLAVGNGSVTVEVEQGGPVGGVADGDTVVLVAAAGVLVIAVAVLFLLLARRR